MFLAKTNNEKRKQLIQELVDYFVQKNMSVTVSNDKYTNDKIIKQRKLEYRRRQAECSELIVTKPGIFIGLTNRGITIKEKGVLTGTYRPVTISHIVITTNGVALSSNLIRYCVSNKIPIDLEELEIISIVKFDSIAIYPICAECYAKAKYIPKHLRIMPKGNTIVVP